MFETKERTSKAIVEELFEESEKYLCQMIGQIIEASGCHLTDEIDSDQVRMINSALKYWHKTKELCIEQIETMERKEKLLNERLDKQEDLLKRINEKLEDQIDLDELIEKLSQKKDK